MRSILFVMAVCGFVFIVEEVIRWMVFGGSEHEMLIGLAVGGAFTLCSCALLATYTALSLVSRLEAKDEPDPDDATV